MLMETLLILGLFDYNHTMRTSSFLLSKVLGSWLPMFLWQANLKLQNNFVPVLICVTLLLIARDLRKKLLHRSFVNCLSLRKAVKITAFASKKIINFYALQ